MKISIQTTVNASLQQAWSAWTTPEHIVQWNFASKDGCCPRVAIDLKVGGQFSYRMEAKGGSPGFDFGGAFTQVVAREKIEFVLADDRKVLIEFSNSADGVTISETFDAEDENSGEQQKQGWQAILNNFKSYVDTRNY